MPDRPEPLPKPAIDLLLQTIELPGAHIAGAALQDHFENAAASLIAAKLLVMGGHATSAAPLGDHDDFPLALDWFPELEGHGHYSRSVKPVKISSERVSYFKADITTVIARLATPLLKAVNCKPVALIEDILWELGEADLDRRGKTTPLWFARRLHDIVEWDKVKQCIRDRPAPDLRVVLTSTLGHRIPSVFFAGHLILPVNTILRHAAGLTIDRPILVARMKNPYDTSHGPLQHSADYTSVSVRGQIYKFPGSKQRDLVRRLVQAFEAGTPQCSTAEVLQDAGFKDSVNTLAKAFSGRADWRDFMAEANGTCWVFV